jgi:hypothetical protein
MESRPAGFLGLFHHIPESSPVIPKHEPAFSKTKGIPDLRRNLSPIVHDLAKDRCQCIRFQFGASKSRLTPQNHCTTSRGRGFITDQRRRIKFVYIS